MTKLNWTPKYDLAGLVKDMMQADIALFQRDQLLAKSGHRCRITTNRICIDVAGKSIKKKSQVWKVNLRLR